MEKSESIINLAKALILFQMKAEKINKDSNNPFYKSKYASLSHIQETIQIPLAEAGITYLQFPEGEKELTTIIIHAESGEFMQATYEMKPSKDDPQSRGSAITYQKRYALVAALGLNIDEDDDANEATGKNEDNVKQLPPRTEEPEDNKPWLTEELLKQCLARITKGEQGVYNKTDVAFRMKKQYREQLKTADKSLAA